MKYNPVTGDILCEVEGCEHGHDPDARCAASRIGITDREGHELVGGPDCPKRDVIKGCSASWGYTWMALTDKENFFGLTEHERERYLEFIGGEEVLAATELEIRRR